MYVWQIIRAAGQVSSELWPAKQHFLLWVGPIDDVYMRTDARGFYNSIAIVWFGLS